MHLDVSNMKYGRSLWFVLPLLVACAATAVVLLSAPTSTRDGPPSVAARSDLNAGPASMPSDVRPVAKRKFGDRDAEVEEPRPRLSINVFGPDGLRPEGLVTIRPSPTSELAATRPAGEPQAQYPVVRDGSTVVPRPGGPAELVVECPGFEAVIEDFPAKDVAAVDITLREEFVLRGVVVAGPDDAPVAGASVSAWPAGVHPTSSDLSPRPDGTAAPFRGAVSDHQGRFTIRSLPPSTPLVLRAFKVGWIGPQAFRVGGDRPEQEVAIRIAPLYVASAIFVDQDGVPVLAEEAQVYAFGSTQPEGLVLVDELRSDVRAALPTDFARRTAGRLSFLECYAEQSPDRPIVKLEFSADVFGFELLDSAELPLARAAEGAEISQLRLRRRGPRGAGRVRVSFPNAPLATCEGPVGRLVLRSGPTDRELPIGLRDMQDRSVDVSGIPIGRYAARYFSEGNLIVWPQPSDPPLQIEVAAGATQDVVVAVRDVAALTWRTNGSPRTKSRLDVTMIEPRRGAGATHSFDGIAAIVPLFPPSRFDASFGIRVDGHDVSQVVTVKNVEALAGSVVDLDSHR